MFSEILKITPQIDPKDLAKMERTLQSRFTKIAKNFGKGITNVFKAGGIAGIALALIDKVLNPLKEVQEAIDRTLKSSDDIATNAAQFNTSTGKLFKLIQLAKATGLDQDNLFMLITKFQTAVAQAQANPADGSVSSVRNFTNDKDTAESFFDFIQSLQKMDKNTQLLVQQQIFGEKQILKMADFLQTDFTKKFSEVGLDKISTTKLTGSIEKLAGLNDLADVLQARRETQDIIAKSGVINESMIRSRDQSERLNLQKENARIKSYNDLAAISDSVTKIMGLVENGLGLLGNLINKLTPFVDKMTAAVDRWMKSPMVRGIKSLFGGED